MDMLTESNIADWLFPDAPASSSADELLIDAYLLRLSFLADTSFQRTMAKAARRRITAVTDNPIVSGRRLVEVTGAIGTGESLLERHRTGPGAAGPTHDRHPFFPT